MQLRFEHFAATSLMGSEESPPRNNGELKFARDWEGSAFGMALALAKKRSLRMGRFSPGVNCLN